MYMILFLFLIFCSFGVISSRNPIHSILFLVCVFLLSSILLFCLEVEFLGLSFVLIYVGAIAILFLFVVMMLNIAVEEARSEYFSMFFVIGIILLCEFVFLVPNMNPTPNSLELPAYVDWSLVMQPVTNMEMFGNFLFTHGFPYFILSGFILFVSMIGAIVLTLHRQEYTKRQDIYTQVSRSVMIRARTV